MAVAAGWGEVDTAWTVRFIPLPIPDIKQAYFPAVFESNSEIVIIYFSAVELLSDFHSTYMGLRHS